MRGAGSRGATRLHAAVACVGFCLVTSARSAQAQTAPSDADPQAQLESEVSAASNSTEVVAPSATGEAESGGADDTSNLDRARALFWQGHDQYAQGNYRVATAMFEESYAASAQPATLFNVALSMARDRRCEDASRTFRDFSALEMPQAELARAAAIFEGIHTECTAAATPSGQQLAPPVVPPPPAAAPKQSQSQPPATSSRKANSPDPKPVDPTAEASQSYWNRDRTLGWSFAASAVVTAGAALYFNQRQQDAWDEADRIAEASRDGHGSKDAAGEMEELKTERTVFIVASGISAAASAGFALAATKLLVFSGSNKGSTQVAVAVGPVARLVISGEF